jgi:hypothetical protein
MDTFGWTYDQISEEIKLQDVIYKELQAETFAETDPIMFQRKALKFSIVRDRILSLENQRAIVANTNQCLEKLLKVFAEHKDHVSGELQRFEERISRLEENAQFFTEENRELDERISEIEENASRFTAVPDHDSSADLHDLQTDMRNLQLLVDDIDNRTRVRNVVVHGTSETDPMKIVKELVNSQKQLLSQVETAHHIGNCKGKKPLLIRFSSIPAKQAFVSLASSKQFRQDHPGISVRNDETSLTRVGAAKLARVAHQLKHEYPGVRVNPRFAQLGATRYKAAEFAFGLTALRP